MSTEILRSDLPKIEKYIKSIPKNAVDPPADDVILANHATDSYVGSGASRQQVFEEKRKLTKAYEQIVVFDPNTSVLYPGSLIQGKTLPSGTLAAIGIDTAARTKIKITVDGLVSSHPSVKFSAEVDNPDHGNVRDAISKILSQHLNAEQPARMSFSKSEVYSLEEALAQLDVKSSWFFGHVNGSLQTSSSVTKTSFLVRFTQNYYSVSVDAPKTPVAFFNNRALFKDLTNYMGPGNPPTYVDSVSYGRELYLLIESFAKKDDLKVTLDAAFGGVQTNLGDEQKKMLQESDMQAVVLGGGGTAAVSVLTGDKVQGLANYLNSGKNYSVDSPGAPISYSVNYLTDNTLARLSSTTQYVVTTLENAGVDTLSEVTLNIRTGGDDKDDDNHVAVAFTLLPANISLYFDPDMRPRQPEDGDPTWHDNSIHEVQFKAPDGVSKDNAGAQSIRIDISKSGNAHWHFGFDFLLKFDSGRTVPIASYGGDTNNFGDSHNSGSWQFGIPWAASSQRYKLKSFPGLARRFNSGDRDLSEAAHLPPEISTSSEPFANDVQRTFNLYLDGTWERQTSGVSGSRWESGSWGGHPLRGDAKHVEEVAREGAWLVVNETEYD